MSDMNRARRAAIVGAGLAGLACAGELQRAGWQVVVFEKERTPGGRCATWSGPAGCFDHGAWCFTAASPEFAARLSQWQTQGLVVESAGGWVGVPAMGRLPEALAGDLALVSSCEVAGLDRIEGGWLVRTHQRLPEQIDPRFDAVVVALPSESALPLVMSSDTLREAVRAVRSEPQWTVAAAWPVALPLKADVEGDGHAVLEVVRRDDLRPGRERVPGVGCRWVLHAGTYWSANNLDVPPHEVSRRLLAALSERAGLQLARPAYAAAHLWRHARVPQPLAAPCGWDESLRLAVCGDAWHALPGAEGLERAWLSGQAAARHLDASD